MDGQQPQQGPPPKTAPHPPPQTHRPPPPSAPGPTPSRERPPTASAHGSPSQAPPPPRRPPSAGQPATAHSETESSARNDQTGDDVGAAANASSSAGPAPAPKRGGPPSSRPPSQQPTPAAVTPAEGRGGERPPPPTTHRGSASSAQPSGAPTPRSEAAPGKRPPPPPAPGKQQQQQSRPTTPSPSRDQQQQQQQAPASSGTPPSQAPHDVTASASKSPPPPPPPAVRPSGDQSTDEHNATSTTRPPPPPPAKRPESPAANDAEGKHHQTVVTNSDDAGPNQKVGDGNAGTHRSSAQPSGAQTPRDGNGAKRPPPPPTPPNGNQPTPPPPQQQQQQQQASSRPSTPPPSSSNERPPPPPPGRGSADSGSSAPPPPPPAKRARTPPRQEVNHDDDDPGKGDGGAPHDASSTGPSQPPRATRPRATSVTNRPPAQRPPPPPGTKTPDRQQPSPPPPADRKDEPATASSGATHNEDDGASPERRSTMRPSEAGNDEQGASNTLRGSPSFLRSKQGVPPPRPRSFSRGRNNSAGLGTSSSSSVIRLDNSISVGGVVPRGRAARPVYLTPAVSRSLVDSSAFGELVLESDVKEAEVKESEGAELAAAGSGPSVAWSSTGDSVSANRVFVFTSPSQGRAANDSSAAQPHGGTAVAGVASVHNPPSPARNINESLRRQLQAAYQEPSVSTRTAAHMPRRRSTAIPHLSHNVVNQFRRIFASLTESDSAHWKWGDDSGSAAAAADMLGAVTIVTLEMSRYDRDFDLTEPLTLCFINPTTGVVAGSAYEALHAAGFEAFVDTAVLALRARHRCRRHLPALPSVSAIASVLDLTIAEIADRIESIFGSGRRGVLTRGAIMTTSAPPQRRPQQLPERAVRAARNTAVACNADSLVALLELQDAIDTWWVTYATGSRTSAKHGSTSAGNTSPNRTTNNRSGSTDDVASTASSLLLRFVDVDRFVRDVLGRGSIEPMALAGILDDFSALRAQGALQFYEFQLVVCALFIGSGGIVANAGTTTGANGSSTWKGPGDTLKEAVLACTDRNVNEL